MADSQLTAEAPSGAACSRWCMTHGGPSGVYLSSLCIVLCQNCKEQLQGGEAGVAQVHMLTCASRGSADTLCGSVA